MSWGVGVLELVCLWQGVAAACGAFLVGRVPSTFALLSSPCSPFRPRFPSPSANPLHLSVHRGSHSTHVSVVNADAVDEALARAAASSRVTASAAIDVVGVCTLASLFAPCFHLTARIHFHTFTLSHQLGGLGCGRWR
jgi:hypothetical protein